MLRFESWTSLWTSARSGDSSLVRLLQTSPCQCPAYIVAQMGLKPLRTAYLAWFQDVGIGRCVSRAENHT